MSVSVSVGASRASVDSAVVSVRGSDAGLGLDDEALAPPPRLPLSLPTFMHNPDVEVNEEQHRQAVLSSASLQRGQRYRDLTCPRMRSPDGAMIQYPIWQTDIREFKKFGLGVLLYFKLLRGLAIIHMVMFVFALPSLIFNSAGSAYSDSVFAERTTLGNQGTVRLSNSTSDSVNFILGVDRRKVGLVSSSLDLVYTLLFLGFLLWIGVNHRREARAYNDQVVTVSRFAVAVHDIPTDVYDRNYLREFFSKYGFVVDVVIAYNNIELVKLYVKRGNLKKKLVAAEVRKEKKSRIQAIGRKILDLDKEIAELQSSLKLESRVIYVLFNRQDEAEAALKAYPDEFWHYVFMPKHKRLFGEHRIKLRAAPEPSNILYQHIQYSHKQKTYRRIASFFITIALLLVSTAIVYVASFYSDKIPQPTKCELVNLPSNYDPDLDPDPSTDKLYCWCSELSASQLLQIGRKCDSYLRAVAVRSALTFVTAFSTVAINFLIKVLTIRISSLERHSSRTAQEKGVAVKLATGLFFNTAIVILLVNAQLAPLLGVNLGLRFLFDGTFSDLEEGWYKVVGTSLMITMGINMLVPHIFPVLLSLYREWRNSRLKPDKLEKLTQDAVNSKYFSGDRFELSVRYAAILSNLLVTMMYSSGMPLLLLLGAVSCTINYWFDKFTFFRYYANPPRYDESLDNWFVSTAPIAVVLHVAMAIWFYSSPCSESYYVSEDFIVNNFINNVKFPIFNVTARLFQWNCFPFAVLFILLCLYFGFRGLANLLCCPSHSHSLTRTISGLKEETANSITYFEAAQRIRLESYRLSDQNQFKPAYLVTRSLLQLAPDDDFTEVKDLLERVRNREVTAQAEAIGGADLRSLPAVPLDPHLSQALGLYTVQNFDPLNSIRANSEHKEESPLRDFVRNVNRQLKIDTEMQLPGVPESNEPVEPSPDVSPMPPQSPIANVQNAQDNLNRARSGPNQPPLLNRLFSDKRETPAERHVRKMEELRQLHEEAAQAELGAGARIPYQCAKCSREFFIVDHGVQAKYACPFPPCDYTFII